MIVGYAYPDGVGCIGLEIQNSSGLERTVSFEREEGITTRAVSIDQGVSQGISVIGIGCVEFTNYASRQLVFHDGKGRDGLEVAGCLVGRGGGVTRELGDNHTAMPQIKSQR